MRILMKLFMVPLFKGGFNLLSIKTFHFETILLKFQANAEYIRASGCDSIVLCTPLCINNICFDAVDFHSDCQQPFFHFAS